MNLIRLLPVILSFLLLGAHFYRSGNVILTSLCIAVLLLLILRKHWVPRLFQVLLALAALEWLWTLYGMAAMRIAWNQPWTRLAVILIGVALFTLLSSLVFRNDRLRTFYGLKDN